MKTYRISTSVTKALLGLIVISCAVPLGGCNRSRPTPAQPHNLTFAVDVVTMAAAPIYVADAKGFWKSENLDVEIRPVVSGRLALDALVGGAALAATVVDVSVVLAAFQGHQLQIVATFSNSATHVNMLARKDRGIERPEDLRSKRVAVSPGTSAEFVMNMLLNRHGLSVSDLSVVALNPPEMVAAITRGDVDAVFTWQPHAYNIQQALGSNCLAVSSNGIYDHPFNIVVMKQSISKNEEALRKLVRGLIQAAAFMRTNRAEAVEIVARRIGADRKVVDALWDQYSYQVGLSATLAESLEVEGEWARQARIVEEGAQAPDYQSLIFRGLLPDVP